jgi:hypothetical protein
MLENCEQSGEMTKPLGESVRNLTDTDRGGGVSWIFVPLFGNHQDQQRSWD